MLREKYPLMMTETNYWMKPDISHLRNVLSLYEKLDMSWFSLDGRGRSAVTVRVCRDFVQMATPGRPRIRRTRGFLLLRRR